MLQLNAGLCVRSLSVESECNKCELVCPTTAIAIGESNLPAINFSECVTCGACTAICPSEALTLDEFDATNFFLILLKMMIPFYLVVKMFLVFLLLV
ncbi:MAG: 4Fe-4S binding protein [Sulfurimonas sp.]|nr:4Fe-4S binding protein [Sulfurimonas sp.]